MESSDGVHPRAFPLAETNCVYTHTHTHSSSSSSSCPPLPCIILCPRCSGEFLKFVDLTRLSFAPLLLFLFPFFSATYYSLSWNIIGFWNSSNGILSFVLFVAPFQLTFFFFFSEVEEILASHRDVLFFVSNINRVLNFDEFLFFNSSSFWKSWRRNSCSSSRCVILRSKYK